MTNGLRSLPWGVSASLSTAGKRSIHFETRPGGSRSRSRRIMKQPMEWPTRSRLLSVGTYSSMKYFLCLIWPSRLEKSSDSPVKDGDLAEPGFQKYPFPRNNRLQKKATF